MQIIMIADKGGIIYERVVDFCIEVKTFPVFRTSRSACSA